MIRTPSYSFNRPDDTNSYTAGDLVANNTTAGSVDPMTFNIGDLPHKSGVIGYVRLFKDDETTTNANFNLHLYTESPVVTNGDNGAFAVSTSRYYLGSVACDMSSGALATTTDLFSRFQVLSGSNLALFAFDVSQDKENRVLYGLLEAAAAYSPAAEELFEVTLEIGSNGGRD